MDNVLRMASAPVVITCYGDMEKRARFRHDLDPKAHKLAEILTEYEFRDEVRCGLVDCHQGHKWGFLIVTEDGTETNIGNKCGRIYFKDQFVGARRLFKARQEARAHSSEIDNYLAKAPSYEAALRELRSQERGGEWADRCLFTYHNRCPDSVQRRVEDLLRSASRMVTKEVIVNKDNATGLGLRGDARTEEQAVGVLRGGAALAGPVEDLLRPLIVKMGEYRKTDPASLSTTQRRQWTKWATSIPRVLEDAQNRIAAAREFYTGENLTLLVNYAANNEEEKKVRACILSILAVIKASHRKAS